MTKETTMMTGDEVNRSCTHIAGATIGACPDCVDIALKEARREERERMRVESIRILGRCSCYQDGHKGAEDAMNELEALSEKSGGPDA